MNRNTGEHIDGRDRETTPDTLEQDKAIQTVLTEVGPAHKKLNQLNQQLDEQKNDIPQGFSDLRHYRLSIVINSMADGVAMINERGALEIANPAAKNLLGLPVECSLSTAQAAMENLGLKHLFSVQLQNRPKTTSEFTGKTVNSKILQMKWNAIIDDHGHFLGNIVVMRDTTAQIKLDEAQTEFIAAISHELRTPLTTVQNSISNMLAGVTGTMTPKMNQYLNAMQGDCHRLARLINDLLDVAKLEAGKMHISRSATNIVEVAAKAVQAFSKCAAEKSLSLETNAGACISRVYVDSQRIYQVFSNLITNAIKYTDKGGKICISVFERDDEVVTVVEDTGVGIAAEHQRHIFNKFYQIARRAGPGYSGSGLGLALSKEIVVTHGGKMWVESEPGKGSKFYFSLPKVKPQIILHKHLGVTAQRAHKKGERFAVLVVRLETSDSYEEQHRQALEAAMKQIMLVGDELTMASSDLVIRKGELEAVLVISQTGKRYLGYVRKKLRDAIFDVLKDYPFNCDPILPMLGIAIYPSDAAAVEEIEKIAASEMNRIL